MRHKALRPLLAIAPALGLGSTLTPTLAAQPNTTTEPEDSAAEQQAQKDRTANPLARALAAAPVNCTTYWPSPYKVCGAIREKYDAIGGPTSFLTWPKSDELGVPDGVGRRNEFVNGFIYWHPTTGAHPTSGDILFQWRYTGYERGPWGYPAGDPIQQEDGWYRQKVAVGHAYGLIANGLADLWAPDGNIDPGFKTTEKSSFRSISPNAGGNDYTDQAKSTT